MSRCFWWQLTSRDILFSVLLFKVYKLSVVISRHMTLYYVMWRPEPRALDAVVLSFNTLGDFSLLMLDFKNPLSSPLSSHSFPAAGEQWEWPYHHPKWPNRYSWVELLLPDVIWCHKSTIKRGPLELPITPPVSHYSLVKKCLGIRQVTSQPVEVPWGTFHVRRSPFYLALLRYLSK